MSLAARCPACGTVFRVVQDQLRVSEGWVRCGRCAEVFNAIESLVDLDADSPGRSTAPPPQRSRGADRVIEDMERVSRYDEMADLGPLSTFGTPAAPPQTQRRPAAPPPVEAPPPPSATFDSQGAVATGEDTAQATRSAPPAFVRQAERAARWRRPGVRAALLLTAAAATLLLAAQWALEYRNTTAARWPLLRPALAWSCERLGCRLEAPRQIDALAVESSGLLRIEGTSLYRLSVVLRSRSSLALALPALDLTLTDSQGGVMARRVITPQELGLQRADLPPAAEFPLQATLSAADRPISGYTIEIFYP